MTKFWVFLAFSSISFRSSLILHAKYEYPFVNQRKTCQLDFQMRKLISNIKTHRFLSFFARGFFFLAPCIIDMPTFVRSSTKKHTVEERMHMTDLEKNPIIIRTI